MFPICCAVYKEELPIESYSYEEFCILSSFAKLQLCIEAANQFPFFLWFVHPACSSHAALLNPKSNCCQPHLPVRHPFCRSDSPSLRFTFGKIGIPSAVCCSRTKNPFILETILLGKCCRIILFSGNLEECTILILSFCAKQQCVPLFFWQFKRSFKKAFHFPEICGIIMFQTVLFCCLSTDSRSRHFYRSPNRMAPNARRADPFHIWYQRQKGSYS